MYFYSPSPQFPFGSSQKIQGHIKKKHVRMQRQKPDSFIIDNLCNHMVFDLTLWITPLTIYFTRIKDVIAVSEQKPISKSYTALWLPHVSLHLLRPLIYLFTCSPMLQSWYVFTSSHISSTVIKTIMKLRNSSFAERSMAVSQKGRRTEETSRRGNIQMCWMFLKRCSSYWGECR